MAHASPGLNVSDVRIAITWYQRVLGFAPVYVVPGDDPPYAVLRRGALSLHLRRRAVAAGTSFCYLTVENADHWFAECETAGATFRRRIETSPYGLRDFELSDCCGNLIGIGHQMP